MEAQRILSLLIWGELERFPPKPIRGEGSSMPKRPSNQGGGEEGLWEEKRESWGT